MVKQIKTTTIKTPSLAPSKKFTSDSYDLITQNKPINDISRLNSKQGTTNLLSTQIIKSGDITATISDAKEGSSFTPTEAIIFDYMLAQHTRSNNENSRTISFSVTQYMNGRNLKDRRNAKHQLDKGLKTFLRTTLAYSGMKRPNGKGKRPKDVDAFDGINILTSAHRTPDGIVTVSFSPEFNDIITKRGLVMPYAKATYQINPQKHPHAYYIVRKMQEQKRIAYGEPNADRLRISTLLKAIPSLPTYEEVKKTNRNYSGRIIEPFFRDLGETPQVQQIFKDYAFLDPDGQPFTKDTYDNLSYDQFINSMLVVTAWINYPEESVKHWKEKQKKNIDNVKKSKK